ncbi:MAG: aminotransferase class V-fold PLP-dependent enzyme [Thermodesulfobacteriota bacterium]|nr:MAG: aminotransferase class V-fold PLP-dependent enzyme [Thermodesulfobacteriota bacterium]
MSPLEGILDPDRAVLFGYARTALEYGYRHLGLKQGDEVLYPDLICDVMMVPCQRLGLKVKFYKVKDDLEPDLKSVARLITEKTKAVLAVNYFGFPQDLKALKEACSSKGLYLIEDSSHSFLGKADGMAPGMRGDMGLLSFRKLVPVLNGAALLVNRADEAAKGLEGLKRMSAGLPAEKRKRRLVSYLKLAQARYGLPLGKLRRRETVTPPHGSTESEAMDFGADEWSLSVLAGYPFEKEARRRRANYRKWVERLSGEGFRAVKELPLGVVPSSCPMFVDERDKWLRKYSRKGHGVSAWPTLPLEVWKAGGSAVSIWKKLILFPV